MAVDITEGTAVSLSTDVAVPTELGQVDSLAFDMAMPLLFTSTANRRDILLRTGARFPPAGGLVPVDLPVTFGVQRTSTTTVQLDFARALRAFAPTTSAVRYSVIGPSVITVGSVAFTPGSATVVLTVSGAWVAGTYTVTVANETARALASDDYNSTAGVSLVVVGNGGGSSFNTGFN